MSDSDIKEQETIKEENQSTSNNTDIADSAHDDTATSNAPAQADTGDQPTIQPRRPVLDQAESLKQTLIGMATPVVPDLQNNRLSTTPAPADDYQKNSHDNVTDTADEEVITPEVARQLKDFFQINSEKPVSSATPPMPNRGLLTNEIVETFDFGDTGNLLLNSEEDSQSENDLEAFDSTESDFPPCETVSAAMPPENSDMAEFSDPIDVLAETEAPTVAMAPVLTDLPPTENATSAPVPQAVHPTGREFLPSVMEVDIDNALADLDIRIDVEVATIDSDEDFPIDEIAPEATLPAPEPETVQEDDVISATENTDIEKQTIDESLHETTTLSENDEIPSVNDFLYKDSDSSKTDHKVNEDRNRPTQPSLRAVQESETSTVRKENATAAKKESTDSTSEIKNTASESVTENTWKKVAGFLFSAAAIATIGFLIVRNPPAIDTEAQKKISVATSSSSVTETPVIQRDETKSATITPPTPQVESVQESIRTVSEPNTLPDHSEAIPPPVSVSASQTDATTGADANINPSAMQKELPATVQGITGDLAQVAVSADGENAPVKQDPPLQEAENPQEANTENADSAATPAAKITATMEKATLLKTTADTAASLPTTNDTLIFPARFKTGTAVFCFMDKSKEKKWMRHVRTQAKGKQILVRGYVTQEEKDNRLGRIAISRAWAVQKYLQRRGVKPETIESKRGKLQNRANLPIERTEVVRLQFLEPTPEEK